MAKPDPRAPVWRQQCLDGTISKEDYAEAVKWLRGERRAAEELAKVKGKKGKRKKKEDESETTIPDSA